MSFETLWGNEQLKTSLRAAIRQEKLSHSYLICGAPGSGRKTLARLLAAAMECTAPPADRPCLGCTACRKVMDGVHPDVITVDDEGKRTVSVKTVRTAREDLYIRPNEGRRKVYLFPRAMDLNASGENALLKVMEEPPEYGAYLLLAEHPSQLLPTIRSRCVTLRLSPLTRAEFMQAASQAYPKAGQEALESAFLRSGGILGQGLSLLAGVEDLLPQTLAFAQAYGDRDALALLRRRHVIAHIAGLHTAAELTHAGARSGTRARTAAPQRYGS